jgi:ubiquinone/menaquinone biosynthesis C-methylase UbiE
MLLDQEFDLVFACAALHHTMKYPGAVEELARIMKPGARLVLCETWGGNPLLNVARKIRAIAAGEQEEQGENIILSRKELKALEPHFEDIHIDAMNLFAMGKRMFRGRFEETWARKMAGVAESVDSAILHLVPPLRDWCGEAVITARRR